MDEDEYKQRENRREWTMFVCAALAGGQAKETACKTADHVLGQLQGRWPEPKDDSLA